MAALLVGYGYSFPSHPGKWRVHANLTRLLKPGVPEPQLVTRFGQRFRLTPDDHAQANVFWFGERDCWEMHHVARVLKPGAVVIDAGANFGYQALTLLRLSGQACRVIAVEPEPANFKRLEETIELNGLESQIEAHQIAFSDKMGTARIVPDRANSGHAMIRDGDTGDPVEVVTLDAFADRHGLERLDALLVDTEGLEDRVIAGGARSIARLRPVILVELWPPVLAQQGTDAASVARVLEGLGYRMYKVDGDQLTPVAGLPTTDVRFYAMCFHKDSPQPNAIAATVARPEPPRHNTTFDSLATKALVFYGARLPNHPRKWWVVDKLRTGLKLAPAGEREVVRRGLRFFLDPSDFEHTDLFWMGLKDRAELGHLERLVGRNGVFLDIGANLGYYSLELSRRLGPDATMHAFEPNPPTYDRLHRHVEANGMQRTIKTHRMALSDQVGQARMINLPGNSGATRLGDGDKGFDVVVSTVDAFAEEHKLERIDAMKLDVEGFEANVLRGAMNSLARWKPHLIVEFWQWGLDKAGSSAAEVIEVLDRAGYVMHDLHGAEPRQITELPDLGDPYNVLCVHRDRLADISTKS